MYVMLGTRLDLAQSVLIASRYYANLTKDYQEQTKRIMQYIRGILEARLEFTSTNTNLIGFSDAKYAGDRLDSKSIRGYVFTLGGTIVSQRCKK